ncbi:Cro/Cl family transcriptional regulator, partial [Enterococcus faecium]
MDRYKDIHKKAKPLKRDTGSIFARRERKRTRMENEEDASRIYEREQHSFEHLNQYEQQIYRDAPRAEEQQKNKKFFNRQKKNKPLKPRRKRSWKKIILSILLVLILYSGISFFIGKYVAEHDTSLEAATSETFHGQKATNGAHNILILGSDTRGEDAGRADTI